MHLLVRVLILFSLNLYLIGGNGQMHSSAKPYVCERVELRERIGLYEYCYKHKWSPLPYPNAGLDGRLCCFLKDQECHFEKLITNGTFITVEKQAKNVCKIIQKNNFEELMKKRFDHLINHCFNAKIHLSPEFCDSLGPHPVPAQTPQCQEVYYCSTDRLIDPKIPTNSETQKQGYLCKDMVEFYYANKDLQKCFQHKWGLQETSLNPDTQEKCCLNNDVICLHNQMVINC